MICHCFSSISDYERELIHVFLKSFREWYFTFNLLTHVSPCLAFFYKVGKVTISIFDVKLALRLS